MDDLLNAFTVWLNDPLTRPPLPVTAATGVEGIDLLISTRRSKLTGWLSPAELVVSADWSGDCWDLLLSLDVSPVQIEGGGWVCEECPDESRRVFDRMEDLWRDHLFDPLAAWLIDKVEGAEVLAFYQADGGGVGWAKLHHDADHAEGAAHVTAL